MIKKQSYELYGPCNFPFENMEARVLKKEWLQKWVDVPQNRLAVRLVLFLGFNVSRKNIKFKPSKFIGLGPN